MSAPILVVADEPRIVRLARDYLEKNGFGVISTMDRKSALRLAITKQLVQAHEGTISAENEVGKGTTFIIELPA